MYSDGYWKFLTRLHEIWGMKQPVSFIPLLIKECQGLEDRSPTNECLKHCSEGLDQSRCGGFIYEGEDISFSDEKAKEIASYLDLLSLQRDEVRQKEIEAAKKGKKE